MQFWNVFVGAERERDNTIVQYPTETTSGTLYTIFVVTVKNTHIWEISNWSSCKERLRGLSADWRLQPRRGTNSIYKYRWDKHHEGKRTIYLEDNVSTKKSTYKGHTDYYNIKGGD